MLFRNAHQPFGFRVRKGLEQHAVDDRKDRCGRPDAERQRQQGGGGKLLLRRIIVSAYRMSRSRISIGTGLYSKLDARSYGLLVRLCQIGISLQAGNVLLYELLDGAGNRMSGRGVQRRPGP